MDGSKFEAVNAGDRAFTQGKLKARVAQRKLPPPAAEETGADGGEPVS